MRDAPSMTCAFVTTIPDAATISPEPSDCAFRVREPKNEPKKGSTSRTIDSAAMLTTDGATLSTTSTIGVLRTGSDCPKAGARQTGEKERSGEERTILHGGETLTHASCPVQAARRAQRDERLPPSPRFAARSAAWVRSCTPSLSRTVET